MNAAPDPLSLHAEHVVLGPGGDGALRVAPASLVIEGAKIASVTEQSREQWRAATGGHGLDLGNRVIAPAFIDAHTHLSMTAFRGLISTSALQGNVVEDLFYRLEERLTDDDVRAFCRVAAFESLSHGVGLVWDHYYGGTAGAEGLADAGIAAVVAPTLQDLHGPGADRWERQLAATIELDDPAWAERGIWAALGPHATDTVSPDLWRTVAELARERALVVHAHVAQSFEEYERAQSRHQCSPVELLSRCSVLDGLDMLLVHAIFMSDADLDRLDPRRHALAYCPLSQMQFCFPAHVPSWTERDLPWVVGTDCAPSNDAMNVQRELPLVAATRGFAPTSSEAYATFRRTPSIQTARGADAVRTREFATRGRLAASDFLLSRVWSVPGGLHPGFVAGTLAPGALANLLVLDPSHPTMWPGVDIPRALAMSDTSLAIERMMVCGRWSSVAGGRLAHHAEYQDARREADERLERHLDRIGFVR